MNYQHVQVEKPIRVSQWALNGTDKVPSKDYDTNTVITSVFPAPGDKASSLTLPHVVFRGPHLPWARRVSEQPKDSKTKPIPWLALIPFTADELELSEDDASSFVPKQASSSLNENLGWDMAAGDVKDINSQSKVLNLIPSPATENEFTPTSVVFVSGNLFKTLFKSEKVKGIQDEPITCDIAKFRYLSHVRSVAAGYNYDTCGITISHRTGPLNVQSQTPVFVHLVSLQGIDGLKLSSVKERVAITSLYSWSYMVLPPDSSGAFTSSRHLNVAYNGIFILPTYETSEPSHNGSGRENNPSDVERAIKKKQTYGYAITRHRSPTGEVSVAIVRGPLVPAKIPHPLRPNMPWQSNNGMDLKIQDPDLATVDLTYSTAWHLGRNLALDDQHFTAALSRVRRFMYKDNLDRPKPGVAEGSKSGSASRDEVLASLRDLGAHPTTSTAATIRSTSEDRWPRSTDPNIDSRHNTVPSNTDYTILQDWLLKKVQLSDIPWPYLIPDLDYLPKDSIRFFHVDENWIDVLTDGALCIANHFADKPEDDYARSALKARLNTYLHSPREDLKHCQQIPVYGFMFRSKLIEQFPDINIAIIPPEQPNGQINPGNAREESHILIQRRFDPDNMMLVLFDRELPELSKVQFTFRDHNRTFAIPTELYTELTDKGEAQDETVNGKSREYVSIVTEKGGSEGWPGGRAQDYFDLESRTLNVSSLASTVRSLVENGGQHTEEDSTSAALASKLSKSSYVFEVTVQSRKEVSG